MLFERKKPENNGNSTQKSKEYLEISAALVELSQEIVKVRAEFAKLQGKFGGRPTKNQENAAETSNVLKQTNAYTIFKDGRIENKN